MNAPSDSVRQPAEDGVLHLARVLTAPLHKGEREVGATTRVQHERCRTTTAGTGPPRRVQQGHHRVHGALGAVGAARPATMTAIAACSHTVTTCAWVGDTAGGRSGDGQSAHAYGWRLAYPLT